MGTLILKSKNALDAGVKSIWFSEYEHRVVSDGGYIVDEEAVNDALDFISVNKIARSSVFTATSAQWGVKVVDGRLTKLYSLINPDGDIYINLEVNAAEALSDDYGFKTLKFKGNQSDIAQTKALANGVNNAGFCVVALPVPSDDPYFYSYSQGLGLYTFSSPNEQGVAPISRAFGKLVYVRDKNTQLPASWYKRFIFGESTNMITIRDSSGLQWSTISVYKSDTDIKVFDGSSATADSETTITPSVRDGFRLRLAAMESEVGVVINQTPQYFAESWCLINTTPDKVQALSIRASQKYSQ